jgi:hypothetical protein
MRFTAGWCPLTLAQWLDAFMHGCSSREASALNEPDEYHDNSDHQQDVDEPSHRVTAHKSKEPKDQQNYCNRP